MPAPKQAVLSKMSWQKSTLCYAPPTSLTPNNLAFADYGKTHDIIPIDCPIGDAERVAHQLHRSAGCIGVDAKHLKNQLLKHGKASAEL